MSEAVLIEVKGIVFRRSTVQTWPYSGKREAYRVHGCLVEDNEGTTWPYCGTGLGDDSSAFDWEEPAGPITCQRCSRATESMILRRAEMAAEVLVG